MKRIKWFLMGVPILALMGCATLQELAALRKVDFRLDRVSDPQLAGVSLKDVRSYQDISLSDAARLGLALANEELPLTFVLYVKAQNPADNSVPARFLGMDWTLFLQNKETVRGVVDQTIVLPPGEPQDVPVTVGLNLIEFFDGNIRDLVNVAASLSGREGTPTNIRLEVIPTIETSLGPIKYPKPVVLVNSEVSSGG